MISDTEVIQLVRTNLTSLVNQLGVNEDLPTQFYRGIDAHNWVNQHPGACLRHKSVFVQFDIIPRYCFDCFKIKIDTATVMELFKLMILFEKLKLERDNTRKCYIEVRNEVAGSYSGLIYCSGLEEANNIFSLLHKLLPEKISDNIPVSIKRGCSEFAISYPEYPQVIEGSTIMDYKSEWQEKEDIADNNFVHHQRPVMTSNNQTTYSVIDAKIMLAWLRYAETIGDRSYMVITGEPVAPFLGLQRPS